LLQSLQVTIVLAAHLHLQDFDGVEAHAGRFVDAALDRQLAVVLEPPERVRGNGDWISAARPALVGRLVRLFGLACEREPITQQS
jgi:hypothetical protein